MNTLELEEEAFLHRSGMEAFLHRSGIDLDRFHEADIGWETVRAIVEHFRSIAPRLESPGHRISESLLSCPEVRFVKYRLKKETHLVEKIIRKRIADSTRRFDERNYHRQLHDLVGVRALHLFKEDWISVHRYILSNWNLADRPTAYIRAGDSETSLRYYRQYDCEVREHRFGYRSVQYLVSSPETAPPAVSEIQARTLFEEAWGEIDHVISYPNDQANELLLRLSLILSRFAADADELGSDIRYLKHRDAGFGAREAANMESYPFLQNFVESRLVRSDCLQTAQNRRIPRT